MKFASKTRSLITAAGLLSMLAAGNAAADYRVTAFGYSSEYEAVLSGDVATAKSILSKRSLASLDFVESNNLCVTQILAREFPAAVASCSAALEKIESDRAISAITERTAKASIYSNLAVAKAMSGDLGGASEALETALSLNASDRNAVANYSQVREIAPVTEVAQNL